MRLQVLCWALLLVLTSCTVQPRQAGSIATSQLRSINSSVRVTVSHRTELMAMVMPLNSSVHREALRVLDIDGCQAAVHKAEGSKARFLLEPLLCWRAGMERRLCPGFDYTSSRHFLRVPVLLTDPALPDKAKRQLRGLYPTSLSFMNMAAIQLQLQAAGRQAPDVELESQLGAAGGSTYLLLRAYCTSQQHCRDMRRGLASQPSLFFEKLRLTLHSTEYSSLNQSQRSISAGPFACQSGAAASGLGGETADAGDSTSGALPFVNQTQVVEVNGQLYFLLQQRSSGRVSFDRDFEDYENGFGDPRDDFWIGLRLLHSLTKANRVMRVEMIRHRSATFDRDLFHAEYTNFKVGPAPTYTMTYSAINKATSSVTADGLHESRGRPFSTRDRDNDRWGQSCSRVRGGSGGWWFNACGKCNPNGVFIAEANARNESGIRWEYLDSRGLSGNATLKYIRMLLRV